MKLSSYFLTLSIINASFCKSHQKHNHGTESIEGDTLIDKILTSNRFHELADKIVEKAVEKINNQQSAVTSLTDNDPEIETKKSNANPNPEFKSLQDLETKNEKPVKKKKKSLKQLAYKPGKIDTVAVLQKKILPSDDLTFRYDRFTKNNRAVTVSDSPLAEQTNTEKSNLNVENGSEESTTKHKIVKKPSADGNSEEQSETDENSSNEENKRGEKTTQNDLSLKITKLNGPGTTRTTKTESEKVILWNGRHTDNEDNDSEDKTDEEDIQETKQTSPRVTKEKISGKETTDIPHLFRAETVSTSTPKDKKLNEVDDNTDYENDDVEDSKEKQKDIKNKTKRIVRREGDRTFVLKDSSEYQEYHEELAKLRKSQP